MPEYSLRKSKKILIHLYKLFRSKRSQAETSHFIDVLEELQNSILQKDRSKASLLAKKGKTLYSSLPKKALLKRVIHFVIGLGFALIVAVIIRQMWFELYEIPTGSMRPTFKEQDRVIVSKSKFGINFPLLTKHLYFDKDLCKRMSIFVFTAENMNTTDSEMLYFYLFPGKKQYIKRLVGKPGDTLYFYGGKIYGVDQEGNDISPELQQLSPLGIEHIPFIRFEGTKAPNKFSSSFALNQMGENVVKISLSPSGRREGKFLSSKLYENHDSFADYYDLWGFKNYAFARLVPSSYLDSLEKSYLGDLSSYPLVLEMHHSPSIKNNQPFRSSMATIGKSVSYLPLSKDHLKKIFKGLYTARFIVKNGNVTRYGSSTNQSNISIDKIPDGTYEFYHGKAYCIYPTGVAKELPEDHPLYEFSTKRLQTFFNLGIEFHSYYNPKNKDDFILPSRYAYFREGDLYLLGQPIVYSNDPELTNYIDIENKKSRSFLNYTPFIDHGPPLKTDGSLNIDMIHKFGLKVPDKHYLALGDNHAMSGDSRDFGFVPEENIKGTPSVIFWPPGSRFGTPTQVFIPWFSFPNIFIWTLGIISLSIGIYVTKRKTRFPIDFERS